MRKEKCKACKGKGHILIPEKMAMGMVCGRCGYGWWPLDSCCGDPKPSNVFASKQWEDDFKKTLSRNVSKK